MFLFLEYLFVNDSLYQIEIESTIATWLQTKEIILHMHSKKDFLS